MSADKTDDEVLAVAVAAFRKHQSYRRAAESLGIKTSTLRNRVMVQAVLRGMLELDDALLRPAKRSREEILVMWDRQLEVGMAALAAECGLTTERLRQIFRGANLKYDGKRCLRGQLTEDSIEACRRAAPKDSYASEWEAAVARNVASGHDRWSAEERATVSTMRTWVRPAEVEDDDVEEAS